MTTYLLHGGATSKDLEGNNKFFGQFTELVSKNAVKVLLCYWSRNKNEWQKLTDRDTTKIKASSEKEVSFHVVENVEELFSLIDDYNVLYVAGGDAELLEPYYEKLSGLKAKLNGKVYAGSSMGAFMASDAYVLSFDGQDSGTQHKGLGLLPIQTLCHWDVEQNKEEKLNLLDKKKPIIVLNEGEFVRIYEN